MSEVRIGFSGSISFLVGMIRIFLGLAYITVITRSLSPEEFGNWQLILGLLGYVTIVHTIGKLQETNIQQDQQFFQEGYFLVVQLLFTY